jgi:hypothetical protein
MVASAIATKPPAIHCAAPTASAVPDELLAERLWMTPVPSAAAR